MICSIRGATTVINNDKDEILYATRELLEEIIQKNNINVEDIVSIIFTATDDLNKVYPAVSARDLGILNAGLLCLQEMYVKNSLRKCVRLMLTVKSEKNQDEVNHVYLGGAKLLRPDIVNKKKEISIAIDGPSGSGKSTVARLVAKELGYIYVDTGAMYRATALFFMERGVGLDDIGTIKKEINKVKIDIRYIEGIQRIFLDNVDVTDRIREQDVAKGSSQVATINVVRIKLVNMQRDIAKKQNVVMDGRDIGTYVLQDAKLKIYLEASVDVRVQRRVKELNLLGKEASFEKIKNEIIQRDENDKNRDISPLRKAKDAIYLDCSNMSAEEVKNFIIERLK